MGALDDPEVTQAIRLLDVFGIGPLMIYAGWKSDEEFPKWLKTALILSGITTIGYNGIRYLEEEKKASTLDDRVAAMLEDESD